MLVRHASLSDIEERVARAQTAFCASVEQKDGGPVHSAPNALPAAWASGVCVSAGEVVMHGVFGRSALSRHWQAVDFVWKTGHRQ